VVPTGPEWLHELKNDGMRVVARKVGGRVSIWSRNGRPWTTELVAIAAAVRELAVDDLVLDGEAVAHCVDGLPDFHRLLGDGKATACLYAFDVLEIGGEDLRLRPLEERKERLARALDGAPEALQLSERMDGLRGPPCSPTPAAWALRASSRSAGTGPTGLAGAPIGSR
jgi:ATP-dependent DNA ligase